MIIKEIKGKIINDSRNDKTIEIKIKTNVGSFSSSAPNGKSKGKHESRPYKKSIEEDIKSLEKISEYFSEEYLEKFEDLRHVEDITKGHIGANTLVALEFCVLKAIAKEQKKEIWQIIEPEAKKFPRFVGNCIGGGLHSELTGGKRPDFQEFLLIPKNLPSESFNEMKRIKESLRLELKRKDKKFSEKLNDEGAWRTSLNEKEVLDLLSRNKISFGVDVASSSFFKRKKYHYKNPPLDRDSEEQRMYLSNLIKNYSLFYIEDPFGEEDFENFSSLLKSYPNTLVVGDDLTVTDYKRVEKAIKEKSINALIVKPNQNGSLLEVKRICELCKKKGIKIIFSHRSGETKENILADLAFGFEADFIKCGITGKERESKIKRLIEIEKSLK